MILINIGYGEDLAAYIHCRKVWDLYLTTHGFEGATVLFVRTVYDQVEPVVRSGHDLFVRNRYPKSEFRFEANDAALESSLVVSDWTKTGNLETIWRVKSSIRWALNDPTNNYSHFFFTTVTSIHVIEILVRIAERLKGSVYAGTPCVFNKPFFGIYPFIFLSGANTLISRDIAKGLINHSEYDEIGVPNDVWLGLRLKDQPKSNLPRYDIERSESQLIPDVELKDEIRAKIAQGHFHFRVKSKEMRDKYDHLIIMEIYKQIQLGYLPTLESVINKSKL
jgi:hypothetical protein